MPTILLVNDDGVTSPLLAPLARRLAEIAELRLAVPLHERSWTGKSMTRHGLVRAHRLDERSYPELAGLNGYAIEGTPADCTNLGIHELFESPPDWVISGINIGVNAGLNFIVNSGTVGAAFEASLTGVPAAAFSAHMIRPVYDEWLRTGQFTDPEVLALVEAAAVRATQMTGALMEKGLPAGATVVNVNFPYRLREDTPVRWVPVLDNRYGSLFERDGEGFRHAYAGDSWRDESVPADKTVVEGGEISATALSLGRISVPADGPVPF